LARRSERFDDAVGQPHHCVKAKTLPRPAVSGIVGRERIVLGAFAIGEVFFGEIEEESTDGIIQGSIAVKALLNKQPDGDEGGVDSLLGRGLALVNEVRGKEATEQTIGIERAIHARRRWDRGAVGHARLPMLTTVDSPMLTATPDGQDRIDPRYCL
jgi:hypothetical protein